MRHRKGYRDSLEFLAPLKSIAGGLLAAIVLVFARPMASQQRVKPPFSSPAQAPPGAHYVGAAACAQCHAAETAGQPTPMGRASESVADCSILQTHPDLTFRGAGYSYEIARQGTGRVLTVTNGGENVSEPILWAFGQGHAGQTYVFERAGSYYESRVSFYNDTQSLDWTLGDEISSAPSLDDAAGRRLSESETRECFGCHSTGAATASGLEVKNLLPGVTCEACHGPGAEHVKAVQAGKLENLHIFNPGKLSTGDLAEFCGACHRSFTTVGLMQLEGKAVGVVNVRFQPYRLALSKCFDERDPRIKCVACHDPHKNEPRDPLSFDALCLACHRASLRSRTRAIPKTRIARVCPVSKDRCVSCHMPKYGIPGSHFQFTDHEIRVVKAHEPYPN